MQTVGGVCIQIKAAVSLLYTCAWLACRIEKRAVNLTGITTMAEGAQQWTELIFIKATRGLLRAGFRSWVLHSESDY